MDYTQLISVLQNPTKVNYPVVLPDFFVDHFVVFETLDILMDGLARLAEQGGGNLLDNEQFIRRGGNAVNTASALLSLGLSPKLIVTTDEYGASLLKALVDPELDLSHVHTDGRLSSTVSIETKHSGRQVNLMVSDSGSASKFTFSDLTPGDFELIKDSGIVALVNLNHNRNGAELAHDLFQMIKESSSTKTFMDMGDPSGNPEIVTQLVQRVIKTGLVDIIGLNENEVGWIAKSLTGDQERWKNIFTKPELWIEGAQLIANETGVRVDLHTPHYSATINGDEMTAIPAFAVESRVVCGAGDAWNAGDIYGSLLNLPPLERLTLANAVASLYVSSVSASHPQLSDIIRFLESAPILSRDGKKLLKVQ
ncbi:MAG: carbohydrate kinase family protein [Candidatus Thorarchaeota archaeon]|nr:carbohydrate kinase family protein [Candidatus Thorarchaeota archaeon]